MQTMDMIVVKKKRIALIERDVGTRKSRHVKDASTSGVWSMLKSVASVGTTGSESITFTKQNPTKILNFPFFILFFSRFIYTESRGNGARRIEPPTFLRSCRSTHYGGQIRVVRQRYYCSTIIVLIKYYNKEINITRIFNLGPLLGKENISTSLDTFSLFIACGRYLQ